MFNASAFERTANDLVQGCRSAGFGRFAEELRPLIAPAINIHPELCSDRDIDLGSSKIGGRPDLGPGLDWPLADDGWPLSFLTQVNLDQASRYDARQELPTTGLLSFFYDAQRMPIGSDPSHRGKWSVLLEPNAVRLQRATFPAALPPECRFGAAKIDSRSLLTLPSASQIAMETFNLKGEEYFKYRRHVLESLPGESAALLGNPTIVQSGMQRECQMASNGVVWENAETFTDPRILKLLPGAAEWRLLFQLPSLEDLEMYWGGVGYVYFMIRDPDLVRADFRNVWLILQGT
jgi:uncharacterized protein YwqG